LPKNKERLLESARAGEEKAMMELLRQARRAQHRDLAVEVMKIAKTIPSASLARESLYENKLLERHERFSVAATESLFASPWDVMTDSRHPHGIDVGQSANSWEEWQRDRFERNRQAGRYDWGQASTVTHSTRFACLVLMADGPFHPTDRDKRLIKLRMKQEHIVPSRQIAAGVLAAWKGRCAYWSKFRFDLLGEDEPPLRNMRAPAGSLLRRYMLHVNADGSICAGPRLPQPRRTYHVEFI